MGRLLMVATQAGGAGCCLRTSLAEFGLGPRLVRERVVTSGRKVQNE